MAQGGFSKGAKTPLEMQVKPLKIVVKRLSKATELRLMRKLVYIEETETERQQETQGDAENVADESLVSKRTRDKKQRKPKRIPQLCLGDASKNGEVHESSINRTKGQSKDKKMNEGLKEGKSMRSKGQPAIEKIENMKELKRIPQLCLVRMPDTIGKNKGMEDMMWRNKGQVTTTEKIGDMEDTKRSRGQKTTTKKIENMQDTKRSRGQKTTTKKHVGLIDGKRSTRGKKNMENAEKDMDAHDNTKITEEKQQGVTEEKHDLRKRGKTEDKKAMVATQGRHKKRSRKAVDDAEDFKLPASYFFEGFESKK